MMKLALHVFGLSAALAAAHSFAGSGQVSDAEVRRFFETELATGSEKLASIQDGLRLTFQSLPKNAHGNLAPEAVRYILHRYFVQRHGWFIRGLEASNQTWSEHYVPRDEKEWVPSYLLDLMRTRTGEQGTSLPELAVAAAALEDLVDTEARKRMKVAFEMHELPTDGAVTEEQVREVVGTYYIMFLSGGNFNASGRLDALTKRKMWSEMYTGFKESDRWMRELLQPRFGQAEYNFDSSARMVEDIGENYYKFNDIECRDLKTTLMGMEGSKAGRVRLSTFYKKALFSHWRFTEKADYLRILGALDESDPSGAQVILSNYVMSRPNCLESSNLYAICCRNECEDLTGHLESVIGTSTATPKQIVDIVAALPSATVTAPRQLPDDLVSKLELVAASNGGNVPLHGRLFAQWMHHAYPRECPYPHEIGTTSPQTPDEWMAQTGQQDSQASQEEMEQAVQADTCSIESGPAGCGGSELPWNDKEELLVKPEAPQRPAAPAARSASEAAAWREAVMEAEREAREDAEPAASAASVCYSELAVAACLLAFLGLDRLRHKPGPKAKVEEDELRCPEKRTTVEWRAVLAFVALAFVAHAVNLVDTVIFGCTALGGVGILAAQYFSDRKPQKMAPGDADSFSKCCV
mmetsp:Transcript_50614/g.147156  ORF Transcript_50614/g.147156 Transcript_50614/m.147156 type:complete len:638 (+) Transcript_50614:96-2009(+)